jgi:hypothetical protein
VKYCAGKYAAKDGGTKESYYAVDTPSFYLLHIPYDQDCTPEKASGLKNKTKVEM